MATVATEQIDGNGTTEWHNGMAAWQIGNGQWQRNDGNQAVDVENVLVQPKCFYCQLLKYDRQQYVVN